LLVQSLFWQASVGLLIATARRRIKQEAWRRLRGHRLTPPQFGVLFILHNERNITLSGLAEHLGIDAPTACRVVRNLEERKIIRAASDPEDRRRFRLSLTPAGKKLAAELVHIRDQIDDQITHGFSAAEKDALVSGLRRVIENVDGLGEGESRAEKPRRGRRRRR
jgi:DNA-binding MarR family transcriptional regulator